MTTQASYKLIKARYVIDGVADRAMDNGAVLVQGSRIAQVGRIQDVSAPEGAPVDVYDYPTGTLMPGLVDVHCHFNYLGDGTPTDEVMAMSDDVLLMRSLTTAAIHLKSGVTTARETGAKHDTSFSLREGIGLGLTKGPRLVLCGNPVTITGGHMWQMGAEADGPDGVRAAVRSLIKRGADWIKVPATGGSTGTSLPFRASYTVEELKAICDEAHKLGKLVGAHCRCTSGIVNSLDAGVDMIIHVWFREEDGSFNFRPDVAERIAEEGTLVNSTLHTARETVRKLSEVVESTRGSGTDLSRQASLDLETAKRSQELQLNDARRLGELGVPLIPGTDSGFSWYPFGGFGYELECLVLAGFTPMRAILASTRDASKAIDVSDIVGTLEKGKEADILVVNGNPAQDIAAVRDVLAVFQGGSVVM